MRRDLLSVDHTSGLECIAFNFLPWLASFPRQQRGRGWNPIQSFEISPSSSFADGPRFSPAEEEEKEEWQTHEIDTVCVKRSGIRRRWCSNMLISSFLPSFFRVVIAVLSFYIFPPQLRAPYTGSTDL